jgi:hypothetical protein
MPDTVPAHAGYRSSACRIPFQRMRYPQAESAASPRQCWILPVDKKQANPFLILY